MTFVTPALLVVAAVAPLAILAVFLYDRAVRQRLTSRLGELPVLSHVMASASPRRRVIKLVLVQLAVALILVAAARPQIAGKRFVELRGLDLVVALDVSKSMLVDDVGQTLAMQQKNIPASRLGRAREYAVALIDDLVGDRIGPVVFAGAASHFPVTEDAQVAERFLYDLGPADLPPGSNLSEVFRVSRCLLRPDLYDDLGCSRIGRRGHGGDPLPGESLDAPGDVADAPNIIEEKVERGKAMVLLTDGGDPDEDALREVAMMRELGIAVFVVGVGTAAGGIVHEIDDDGRATPAIKKAKDGTPIVSKRDDEGLRRMAASAGDPTRVFTVTEQGEVDPTSLVEALRNVNRGLATTQIDEAKDIFQPFLFAAFMLLVIEAAISTRRRQRYPEGKPS